MLALDVRDDLLSTTFAVLLVVADAAGNVTYRALRGSIFEKIAEHEKSESIVHAMPLPPVRPSDSRDGVFDEGIEAKQLPIHREASDDVKLRKWAADRLAADMPKIVGSVVTGGLGIDASRVATTGTFIGMPVMATPGLRQRSIQGSMADAAAARAREREARERASEPIDLAEDDDPAPSPAYREFEVGQMGSSFELLGDLRRPSSRGSRGSRGSRSSASSLSQATAQAVAAWMAEGVGQKTARALVDADVGVCLLSAKGGLEAALSMLKEGVAAARHGADVAERDEHGPRRLAARVRVCSHRRRGLPGERAHHPSRRHLLCAGRAPARTSADAKA